MGKINKTREWRDRWRQYRLHLECVRRNPRYLEQYRKLGEISDPEESKVEAAGLNSRWSLWVHEPPPDPDDRPDLDSLNEGPKKRKKGSPPDVYLPGDLRPDALEDKALREFQFFPKGREHLSGVLLLVYFPEGSDSFSSPPWPVTTISMARAKKDIFKRLHQFADAVLAKRRQQGLSQKRSPKKLHIDHCFQCLKVYDD